MAAPRPQVLVATSDKIGETMAGPAIRAVELARALTGVGDVTLASAHPIDLRVDDVRAVTFTDRLELEPLIDRCDVVVAMSSLLERFDWIAQHDTAVIADAYDPALFEVLEWFSHAPLEEQEARFMDALGQMVGPLRFADHVLCASDRQRHLLIGMLTALGRVNPQVYAHDPSLERLVTVVPFGLPSEAPVADHRPLRQPAGPFASTDTVIFWGGGIYEWLDPVTLVEAVAALDDPTVKVFFAGGAHPTPEVPEMPMADRVRRRAEQLGLMGTQVVFAAGWIPYDQRAAYLLDADIGASLHGRHLETTFAFRTRMLDYLWAALPILCSAGDSFAELVASRGLGEVAREEDPTDVARAIEALRVPARVDEVRSALRATALELTWPAVAAPLVELCRNPMRAADRSVPGFARPVTEATDDRGGLVGALRRAVARRGQR